MTCRTGSGGPRTGWALAGLLAAAAVEAWLAHRSAAPGGILDRRWSLFAEIAGMWVAFAAGLACVRLLPRRTAVVAVLGLAVVLRLAAVSTKAPLSDDLYRYAWDGVVQSAGIDPYRYPPEAEQLRSLRDPWLWPPEYAEQPRQTLLNRPNVRTIYPPVAEAWFWLEHQVVPLSAQDEGYQLAGLGLDLAILAALLSLLRRAGRDPRAVAAYALAPLPVLEAVQNAHVDALAVLLVLGAVAAGARKPVLSSAALTCAALVKVYPGLLLPLLLRGRGRRLQVVGVAVGLAVLTYLPHVLAVGLDVVGYLPGYLREERYGEGTRYLLVGLLGLRGTAATAVVVVALAGLLAHLLRGSLPLPAAGVRLMAGVLLLTTPVQPWYALLLLALLVLTGDWWALPLTAAGYPLFFATILNGDAVLAGRLSYGAAALVVAAAALRRRRYTASTPSV
ncbi:MAG TPA: glycosyltransferase 87 family protein [Mycobacteriales bacterium]|nr:glycosyltransferase 87 family protein [Mycobacteriales bacterium]